MIRSAEFSGLFTASEVEARLGVPATTLRQWERRYGVPCPQRNGSGYRLYSHDDLSLIEFMLLRLQEGVPASRAAELAQAQLALPKLVLPDPTVQASEVQALTNALIAADFSQAEQLLAQVHAQIGTEGLLLSLIGPALISIGQRWERGEITVAHEHQASAFVRGKVSALLDAAGHTRYGPKVVAACGPQEHHEIGLLTLCVFLRRLGLQVQYLGANTPLGDLGVYARQVDAQAILLSINSPAALEAALQQQRDLLPLSIPVFVGGQLLNAQPEAARELGRWAGPSALEAAQMIVAELEGGRR